MANIDDDQETSQSDEDNLGGMDAFRAMMGGSSAPVSESTDDSGGFADPDDTSDEESEGGFADPDDTSGEDAEAGFAEEEPTGYSDAPTEEEEDLSGADDIGGIHKPATVLTDGSGFADPDGDVYSGDAGDDGDDSDGDSGDSDGDDNGDSPSDSLQVPVLEVPDLPVSDSSDTNPEPSDDGSDSTDSPASGEASPADDKDAPVQESDTSIDTDTPSDEPSDDLDSLLNSVDETPSDTTSDTPETGISDDISSTSAPVDDGNTTDSDDANSADADGGLDGLLDSLGEGSDEESSEDNEDTAESSDGFADDSDAGDESSEGDFPESDGDEGASEDEDAATAEGISKELQGESSALSSENIESYLNSQTGGFTLEEKDVPVEELAIPDFSKYARKKTYLGLVTSVKQMGILSPISVSYTLEYAEHLQATPDEPYVGKKYLLLDGYRRVYAAIRNGIAMLRATLFKFENASEANNLALVFKCILNKYVPADIEEINSVGDMLQERYDTSQSLTEYLLSLHPGDFMKLKDIVNSSDKYPDICDDLFANKKGLEQAFSALQKARKKEDQLRLDDAAGIEQIDAAKGIVDDDNEQALSEEETLDILKGADDDMANAFESGVSDGNIAMAPEDYGQQKVHERHVLPPEVKQAVMIRDDFRCVVCGRGAPVYMGALVVHHPIPVYGGGTDKFEKPVFLQKDDGRLRLNPANNLVTLCDACHEALHTIAFKHRGKIPMTAEYYDSLSETEKEHMKRLKLLISVEAAIDVKLNRNQRSLAQVQHRMPGEGYETILDAYNSSSPSPASNVVQLDSES